MAASVPVRNHSEPRDLTIKCIATIGASGAATLQYWNPVTQAYAAAGSSGWGGVKTFAHTGATGSGQYLVTLDRTYSRVYGAEVSLIATTGLPGASQAAILAANLAALSKISSFTLQFSAPSCATTGATGATGGLVATDPANGDVLLIDVLVDNS